MYLSDFNTYNNIFQGENNRRQTLGSCPLLVVPFVLSHIVYRCATYTDFLLETEFSLVALNDFDFFRFTWMIKKSEFSLIACDLIPNRLNNSKLCKKPTFLQDSSKIKREFGFYQRIIYSECIYPNKS